MLERDEVEVSLLDPDLRGERDAESALVGAARERAVRTLFMALSGVNHRGNSSAPSINRNSPSSSDTEMTAPSNVSLILTSSQTSNHSSSTASVTFVQPSNHTGPDRLMDWSERVRLNAPL